MVMMMIRLNGYVNEINGFLRRVLLSMLVMLHGITYPLHVTYTLTCVCYILLHIKSSCVTYNAT
jgi:hypothetical protein